MSRTNSCVLLFIIILGYAAGVSGPDAKVVMYWNSTYSFSNDEHSLSKWLEGKTASAFINSAGEIEMSFDISGFPHALTSPILSIDCGSFDALRITYSNQLKYSPQDNVRIAVAWMDEVAAQRSMSNEALSSSDIGRLSASPIESGALVAQVLRFDNNRNWKKGTKVYGIGLSIASNYDTIEGKFIIRSIELIDMSD